MKGYAITGLPDSDSESPPDFGPARKRPRPRKYFRVETRWVGERVPRGWGVWSLHCAYLSQGSAEQALLQLRRSHRPRPGSSWRREFRLVKP